jgi:hypothetical protein
VILDGAKRARAIARQTTDEVKVKLGLSWNRQFNIPTLIS